MIWRYLSVAAVTVAAAMLAVASQAAVSARPQTLTVRDEVGDAFGQGKRQPGRRDVDIRSVTLTRGPKKLKVVVETVAPLRPGSYVFFRYTDPEGFEDTTFEAEITQFGLDRGIAFIEVETTAVGQASISGRRITLPIDLNVPYAYVEWYPRFRWLVTVSDQYNLRLGVRDHLPKQRDTVINPRFLWFPK